jgi:hypothetical protein
MRPNASHVTRSVGRAGRAGRATRGTARTRRRTQPTSRPRGPAMSRPPPTTLPDWCVATQEASSTANGCVHKPRMNPPSAAEHCNSRQPRRVGHTCRAESTAEARAHGQCANEVERQRGSRRTRAARPARRRHAWPSRSWIPPARWSRGGTSRVSPRAIPEAGHDTRPRPREACENPDHRYTLHASAVSSTTDAAISRDGWNASGRVPTRAPSCATPMITTVSAAAARTVTPFGEAHERRSAHQDSDRERREESRIHEAATLLRRPGHYGAARYGGQGASGMASWRRGCAGAGKKRRGRPAARESRHRAAATLCGSRRG